MRLVFLFFVSLLFLFSCNHSFEREEHFVDQEENREFNEFKRGFMDTVCLFNPLWAAKSGLHHCDSLLPIPNQENRDKKLVFAQKTLDSLYLFRFAVLSRSNQTNFYKIENFAESSIFQIEKLREWEWNPASYNLYDDFLTVLTDGEYSLEKRIIAIHKKLRNAPEYYIQAKMNLYNPTKAHTLLAIDTLAASLSLFKHRVPDSLKFLASVDFPIDSFNQKLRSATQAIEDYLGWLNNDILPNMDTGNSRDFRLGKEIYSRKFAVESQSIYKVKEVYAKAMEEKATVLDEMYELSDSLWPKYFGILKKPLDKRLDLISMVLDTLYDDYTDSVQGQFFIQNILEFSEDEDLLPEDFFTEKTEVVFGNGSLFSEIQAFIARQTAYYYRKNSKDSYFLQGSSSLEEAWALYITRTFLDKGFGGNKKEIWLVFYNDYLQILNRVIIEYSLQALGLNKEEALELLMQEGFLTEEQAKDCWRKIALFPVENCSYFAAYDEIMKLRAEMRSKYGNDFELEDFHEYFLSFGDIPVKQIRIEMMK